MRVKAVLTKSRRLCENANVFLFRIRTTEIAPFIEDVDAWIYFSGRVVNISHDETSLSIRLPYIGEHRILVRHPSAVQCCIVLVEKGFVSVFNKTVKMLTCRTTRFRVDAELYHILRSIS